MFGGTSSSSSGRASFTTGASRVSTPAPFTVRLRSRLLPATAAASCEKIDEMFSSSTIFSSRRAMSHHDIFLVSSFSSSRANESFIFLICSVVQNLRSNVG